MTFIDFLYKLDGWVWGTPLIVLIMVVGIYYMVKGKFFPFVHFGHAVKNTVLASSTESGKSGDGKISPYRAFCLHWAAPSAWAISPAWRPPLP